MTEGDWVTSTDPSAMLEFLKGKASDRKLRLFAVACCRTAETQVADKRTRKLINTHEAYAEGSRDQAKLLFKYGRARVQVEVAADEQTQHGVPVGLPGRSVAETRRDRNRLLEAMVGACDPNDASTAAQNAVLIAPRSRHPEFVRNMAAMLIHDIFGNPFRPVTIDPSWLAWADGTVRTLAEAIYAERAFDRMPVLGDAIEEAGCDNEDILRHCREQRDHVRGCWMLDLLTGRE